MKRDEKPFSAHAHLGRCINYFFLTLLISDQRLPTKWEVDSIFDWKKVLSGANFGWKRIFSILCRAHAKVWLSPAIERKRKRGQVARHRSEIRNSNWNNSMLPSLWRHSEEKKLMTSFWIILMTCNFINTQTTNPKKPNCEVSWLFFDWMLVWF